MSRGIDQTLALALEVKDALVVLRSGRVDKARTMLEEALRAAAARANPPINGGDQVA